MHFTGRTWRPPYEANSVIIQATSGCTYRQCRFCNLYQNECFRMSPIAEFEEDLEEIKSYQPYDRQKVTNELQYVLDNVDETKLQEYRRNLKSLG